jgi:hypothetical protein
MIERRDFNGLPIDLEAVRRHAVFTDRALLDFLARVRGEDIAGLRKSLMTDAVLQAMATGAQAVRGDGYKLIIRDLQVITAFPAGHLSANALVRGLP